jgi:transposase
MTRFGTGTLKKPIDRQEVIRKIVETIEGMKERTGMPYRMICKTLQLSLASLNRWRRRMRENGVLIKRPGPKKVEPFDPSILDTEIRLLEHGVKRSAGAGQAYTDGTVSVYHGENWDRWWSGCGRIWSQIGVPIFDGSNG